MYRNMRVSVCLPCRNEGNHLKEVVERIPALVDEVIVVSNNSTDNTAQVAKKLGLIVIEDNRVIDGIGYGFAHMTGIARATGDVVVGLDGDGTYPVEELPAIIDNLIDNTVDFIACNRYPMRDGTHIPFKLRLGVAALNAEVRMLYGLKINDILSGMWVFRKKIAPKLNLTMGDWNLSPQIKLSAAIHPSIKFAEHSIMQRQRFGETHQNYFKTGFSHMFWIARNRFTIKPALAKLFVQFLRYGLVAFAALLIDFGLLYLFASELHMHYLVAASLAYTISMLVNFLLCLKWVFTSRTERTRWKEAAMFFTIGFIGLGLTDVIIWGFTSLFGLHYLMSKLLTVGIVFFWSFGARRFIFQNKLNALFIRAKDPDSDLV
ncbi:MAG TPA: bifunctional glycosyltransferase family 2/GtrA family protein [Magnetospirillaceae bacterium]|nr:bifunctional glycosyltransferase family 2/GtrA family protein [Magnetospirillaceae bacterium]